MAFGEQLRALRRARNMTQADVAGGELSVSYISLLESNQRQPTRETLEILAKALGCQPAVLEGRADESTGPAALAVRHAELNMEVGRVAAAREGYQKALDVGIDDPIMRMQATVGLARALQREGELTEAVSIFESCVRSGLLDPAHSVSLSATQGWCRCLYELGELYRAIEVGTRALEELESLGAEDSDQSIQLLATVAAAWFELGELRQAENLLREGMERSTRVKSPLARGAIMWNASAVAAERGRYLEALELADEALAVYRHGLDPRAFGMLLTIRGHFLQHTDPPRLSEALSTLNQALAVVSGLDSVHQAVAHSELSRLHLALGDVDAAILAAERAREQLLPTARLEYARATVALAAATNARGDHERSRKLFTEAATILAGLGASRSAARVWVELATTLANRGDLAGAVSAFTQSARALNLLDVQREPAARGAVDPPKPANDGQDNDAP
ncbi:MAG TPA: tetratricopeptide repeat protein [Jatrophihabitans sp.]|nr:tetratricopeptide repeat protein [Jatrophihabitans sp.]